MTGVKDLHRRAQRGFAIIDQQQVGVADVLKVELDDLVGGVDLVVAKIAAQRVEQDEAAGEPFLGARAPVFGGGGLGVHDRTAQVNLPDRTPSLTAG